MSQCMEQFKAVEKEMKTKAYSKEGLSSEIKRDPKEKERDDLVDFLSDQLDEIGRFLETIEAEEETLQAGMKKKKADTSKAGRLAEISVISERFKWHEGRLQLLKRSLENGGVENQQVLDIKDEIEYVIKEGREEDFDAENRELYDDCNLDSEEAQFGLTGDNDRISSQDAQSVADDIDTEVPSLKKKPSDPVTARRPSTQLKSPLPNLASLTPMGPPPLIPKDTSMKPAPLPTRPPGEVLKYASAAAAAAASDKSGVGIAPLPPPPGPSPKQVPSTVAAPQKEPETASPVAIPAQPIEKAATPVPASVEESSSQAQSILSKSPSLSATSAPAPSVTNSVPQTPAMDITEAVREPVIASDTPITNGDVTEEPDEEESHFFLPPEFKELVDSFEETKKRARSGLQRSPSVQRMLEVSRDTCPEAADSDRPQRYRPAFRYNTPAHYPQEPLALFDDPSLYDSRGMETDTLFYIFYYRQGTYQQYLAARALKDQSWRFHKQYQTWFQRHEEPKQITEEYEQGTYRFFDYESTWYEYIQIPYAENLTDRYYRMNRRKADFKFVYKFLEDDL